VLDIVGKRRWFYALSLTLTIPGLLFILLTLIPGARLGLQFSIDYTGGTLWDVHFRDGTPDPDAIVAVLEQQDLPGSVVTISSDAGRQHVLIRTPEVELSQSAAATLVSPSPTAGSSPAASVIPAASGGSSPAASVLPAGSAVPSPPPSTAPGSPAPSPSAVPGGVAAPSPSASPGTASGVGGLPTEGRLGEIATALQAAFGPIDEVRQITTVGAVLSTELLQQTFILVVIGALAVMLWITFRFGDIRMGIVANVKIAHDVIVVVGVFAILGTFVGVQIDALFVTAMLTVIGFSTVDTIVVFDRIRENRVRHAGEPFEAIVNHSILQTMGRSLNTAFAIVLTLSSLLLFAGDVIRPFILALLVGIITATYSSIFLASPLLLDWQLRNDRRRQRELAAQASARPA
jgi:preprotein translocase subunit SecF